jgi:naphthoate synthase
MLDKKVDAMVEKLKNKFPECTRYTKANVNFFKDLSWFATAGHTRDWLSTHYACWEPNEGMAAFVEKRPPDVMKLRELAAEGKSSEFMWGPYKNTCAKCGAKGLPTEFGYCGACGEKLSL